MSAADYRPPQTADELTDPDFDPKVAIESVPAPNSDPKLLKRKKVSRLAADLKDEADVLTVLALPEGQRLFARLLGLCGWNEPQFQFDPQHLAEVAGRRSIGIQISRLILDASFDRWSEVQRLLEEQRRTVQKAADGKRGPDG